MKKLLFLFFFYCFAPSSLRAGEVEDLFYLGVVAYEKGNFDKAIEYFEALEALGKRSATLSLNLGNAFFRKNKWGAAILHYERGLLLSPTDADLQKNLQIARQKAGLETPEASPFFLKRWWLSLRNTMGPNEWATTTVFCLFLALIGVFFAWKGKTRRQQQGGRWAAAGVLGIFVWVFALAWSSAAQVADSKTGIVLSKQTPVFPSPDKQTESMEMLPEGAKIGLPDAIGDFWKVFLPDGGEGWVEKAAVGKI